MGRVVSLLNIAIVWWSWCVVEICVCMSGGLRGDAVLRKNTVWRKK